MDVNAIFDAFAKMSDAVHLQDTINKKQAQVNSVSEKRCGNCIKWMKCTCIPEKEKGQLKSMNSIACNQFSYCPSSLKMKEEFNAELVELQISKEGK